MHVLQPMGREHVLRVPKARQKFGGCECSLRLLAVRADRRDRGEEWRAAERWDAGSKRTDGSSQVVLEILRVLDGSLLNKLVLLVERGARGLPTREQLHIYRPQRGEQAGHGALR